MIRCLTLTLAPLAAALTAPFASAQLPDWVAPPGETILNTNFVQMQTSAGTVSVFGGVFRFHNVTIPAGSTVRGQGDNPMLWIVDNLVIDGELSVSGQDGDLANLLGSANFRVNGGAGGPAGGHGGYGSPQVQMQSFAGQAGNGPGNAPGAGGGGGLIGLAANCGRGSGGGGGAFATVGDPHFRTPAGTGTSFVQRLGIGGFGCLGVSGAANRTLTGGGPGGLMGTTNVFYGSAYDVHQGVWIQGALPFPIGGSGGGGGGDLSHDFIPLSPNFVNDARGGGGGGGGGCLILVALNDIIVGASGHVTANGGNGGGGEQAGSSNEAGGGGGGSGGMMILAALGHIQLHVKGETYAHLDYDFVLAADGGVCRTGNFWTPIVHGKYPANGQPTIAGATYDALPLGGFGGMGVVQLHTRVGANADGTNTILDDNIDIIRNGILLTGTEKQRYLAWRGFPNAQGVFVDDAGAPTNIGDDEGDIRPAPLLLPL